MTTITKFYVMSKFQSCISCLLKDRPIVLDDYIDNGSDQTIAIIGEAPGYTEAKTGKPFTGKSGAIIRNIIKQIKNYNIAIFNAVLCHPDQNKTPNVTVLTKCKPNVISLIQKYKPNSIITLGAKAFEQISRIYNIKSNDQDSYRFKVIDKTLRQEIMIYKTYHPAYYLRNKSQDVLDHIVETFRLATDNPNLIFIDSASRTEAQQQYQYLLTEINESDTYLDLDVDLQQQDIICSFEYEDKLLITLYKPDTGKKIVSLPIQAFVAEDLFKLDEFLNIPTFIKTKSKLKVVNRAFYRNFSEYIKNTGNKCSITPVIEPRSYANLALFVSKAKNRQFYIPRYCTIDIEVLADESNFPDPSTARHPVICLSFIDSIQPDTVISYYLRTNSDASNKITIDTIQQYLPSIASSYKIELIEFSNEKELMHSIFDKLVNEFGLYVGWNIGFDIGYLINRYINLTNDKTVIPCIVKEDNTFRGCTCDTIYGATIDLLKLYTDVNPDLSSYSLS